MRVFLLTLGIGFLPLAGWTQEAGKHPEHQIRFDPNLWLVKPLSREDHQDFGHRMPCFAHYRKGNRELVFLGTRHGIALDSPSHRLIEEVIQGFAPDCLVVEGFSCEMGPSPGRVLRDAQQKRARGACPEPLFAVALAGDRKIRFYGGEPPPLVTTQALRRVGSDVDALGWLVVRELGQVRREDGLVELDIKLDRLLTRLNRVFQVKAELKVEEFKNWYRERSGKAWDADQVSAAQTAPLAGPMATFFERMAIEVMLAREKHLVSLQARLLAEHQRVLVVYGGGHLIYEAAVLSQMLGPPVRIRSSWAIEKK